LTSRPPSEGSPSPSPLRLGNCPGILWLRSVSSIVEAHHWVVDNYGILAASFTVSCYFPRDFMFTFLFYNDMTRVLHLSNLPCMAPTGHGQCGKPVLSCHSDNSGDPCHAWHLATARQILAIACTFLQPTLTTIVRLDRSRFTVVP
jgi:hypothetical protein